MVKTRLTGHGHNSNDGNYPHCCEWKDNTHYLFVNKQKAAEWHVWQERDCASNPVFPQGGTWPGSREGWCPGDLVKDNDFELTNLMTGNSMSFDYDITKVPDNNKGMGGGIYRMIFQLFQYSAPTHQNDVEIYDVITPNNFPGYSRKNPLCADPVIIVRNNGSEPVTSLDIEYGVSGGIPKTYHWTGALAPNVKQEISVPVPNNGFWLGDSKRTFTAKVSMPNGKPDDYLVNDAFSTNFNLPDFLTDKLVLRYVTNLRPQYYTYRIMNLHNQVVFEKNNLAPQSINLDTLSLPHGCYTLQLLDDANMGLSYWAYPEQGSGSLGIYDLSGTLLKAFNPDFGYIINYSFVLGDLNFVQDRNIDYLITVAPNPAKNVITLNSSYDLGNSELTIIDESGKEYFRLYENLLTFANEKIDIQNLPSGVFFLNVKAKGTVLVRKFVKAE